MFDPAKLKDKLPPGVSFSNDKGLLWKERYVGNFLPVVIDKVDLMSGGKIKNLISLILVFTDGTNSDPLTVSLADLKSTANWFGLNQKCQVDPDCTRSGQYLASIVRFALSTAKTKSMYLIDRPGTHIVGGKPGFCMGESLFPPCLETDSNVKFKPPPCNLDIDNTLTEEEAAKKMVEVVNLSPDVGKMILTQVLLSIMRFVFSVAGIVPCCVLFVVGVSGFGKTVYTSFLSQLYDRAKGIAPPTQLASSFPAAKAIVSNAMNCDRTVIFDDMFPTDSSEIRRGLQSVFVKLVRFIGNQSSPALMDGKEVSEKFPQSGVIIIGEFPHGLGSDAARCLIVELTSSVLNEELHRYQLKPLTVSTFYWYFIQWYISNYDEILSLLEKWLNDFRTVSLGVNPHLQNTYFCFDAAYKLFLHYCFEQGFTTQEHARIEHRSFQSLLASLVEEQNKRVQQGGIGEHAKAHSFEVIRTLYKNGNFHVAKNKKRFSSEPEKYDGLIHDRMLCLRSERLLAKFRQMGYSNTLYDIRNALIDKDALYLDGEGKNKKIGNTRFYGIYLKSFD